MTIREVAARAGVSTATVSRVLAGIGRPKAGTSAAVRAAAEELGYRPSSVARSLRIRRTHTIGLIVTDIGHPFFPDLVKAADETAQTAGYSLFLGSSAYDEQRAVHYLDLMVDGRVDGVIIASSQVSSESWRRLARTSVPAVVVNVDPGIATTPVITSDNEGGFRLATEHLLSLGHRHLAYIGGPATFTAVGPRLAGFRAACVAAGLDPANLPVLPGDATVEGGEEAAARLLADHPDVTGVVCYNDLEAIGVLRALRRAGRRVPLDVSVIGCDDIAAASWVLPQLTTVAQQKAEMGRLAVERLLAMLDDPGPAANDVVRLPMILRVRDSTGPAPAGERRRGGEARSRRGTED